MEPVQITDEFTNPNGEWSGYDALSQNGELHEQKHVDIRSFVPDKIGTQVTMFLMDRFTMDTLNGTELGAYSHDSAPPATVYVINNEGWTYGEVGPQSDRHNWNGIVATCPANQVTTTQSVITAQS